MFQFIKSNLGKSNMVETECKTCKILFNAKPSWLKHGYGKYCSLNCKYIGTRKGKLVDCNICGKKSYKQPKDIKNSKSGKFFCSKSCQTKWRNTEFVGQKHANWKTGKSAYKSVLNRHNIAKICSMCGTNNEKILAVHHIDKNHYNNSLNNLAWVCHNCHHLIHHDSVYMERFMKKILRG